MESPISDSRLSSHAETMRPDRTAPATRFPWVPREVWSLSHVLAGAGDITGFSIFCRDMAKKILDRGLRMDEVIAFLEEVAFLYGQEQRYGRGKVQSAIDEAFCNWMAEAPGDSFHAGSPTKDLRSKFAGHVSEDFAAQRFAIQYRGSFRYCHDRNSWFEWNGSYWRQAKTGAAFHAVRELARSISKDGSTKDRFAAGRSSFAAGVERFARSDPVFATTMDAWDRDPFLLGAGEGTIDLRNGRIAPGRPEDGITKSTSVTPANTADCPLWRSFLFETTSGDEELIRFLQQVTGYCLTGSTAEQVLFYGHGDGGNGKSVFQNTLTGIMNDYAVAAAMETFTASHGERHPTDMAMLRGARLVTASETEDGRAWAENRIKQLTGGDPITARFMRQDFFTYTPSFKLFIIGNHKPALNNVDVAIRRRFLLIPFVHRPRRPDSHLAEKLRLEWPSILRWMIEGCLDWQQNGLVVPPSVAIATQDYLTDQDSLSHWLEECCDVDVGNEYKFEPVTSLFASWSNFAKQSGEYPGSKKSFSEKLVNRGFSRCKKDRNKVRAFSGLRLKMIP
jgi:putative DNA primase/helicase